MSQDVTISAFPYRNWPWGGIYGELWLYANFTWIDGRGITHPGGPERQSEPYQRCPIDVDGLDAIIRSIVTPPTTDVIQGASLEITGFLVDQRFQKKKLLFRGYHIPPLPNPMTKLELDVYNLGRRRRLSDAFITRDEIMALFDQFQGSVLPASDVILGSVVLDRAPVDAALPEVVGSNSLVVPHAYGVATLVAGDPSTVTILDASILANGAFHLIVLDGGIIGRLREMPDERVAGVSFKVTSDNGGDAGDFIWYMFEKP